MGISSIFDPQYPELFLSIAQQAHLISLILTEHIYKMVKNHYADALRDYLKCGNARLYVIEDVQLAFAVTDTVLSISLPHKNGTVDMTTNLMSVERSALKWGEELFDYYMRRSREIKC
jgi:predicted transcriptional regulator